ncbi:MAG: hypothetical protein IKL82_05500 [Clostridia bacterium]|nr:hypothetical protein [Clostridia bacterium]
MKDVKNSWLFKIPVAHRGLWDENAPENTKTAFLQAIEKGYAIEIDVQMTLDKVLVIVHDDNMKRIFGIDKDIRNLTYDEVKDLTPFGKNDKIMTFKEFLELVDGKTPLLIEVKPSNQPGVEELLVDTLKDYKGEFAVQSFNPFIIRNLYKIAPEYLLGVIISKEKWAHIKPIVRWFLHTLLFTYFMKIDFLSVRATDIEKYNKRLFKYPLISWTIRSKEDLECAEKHALNIIFEKTTPHLSHFGEKKW